MTEHTHFGVGYYLIHVGLVHFVRVDHSGCQTFSDKVTFFYNIKQGNLLSLVQLHWNIGLKRICSSSNTLDEVIRQNDICQGFFNLTLSRPLRAIEKSSLL